MLTDLDSLKSKLKATWMSGDYGHFATYMMPGAMEFFPTLGIKPGERVFSLLGRVPELYLTVLGALKAGAVFCPLFSAFGPEPIRARLELGGGRVLVTTPALYKRKVAALRAQRATEPLHTILQPSPEDRDVDLVRLNDQGVFHPRLSRWREHREMINPVSPPG